MQRTKRVLFVCTCSGLFHGASIIVIFFSPLQLTMTSNTAQRSEDPPTQKTHFVVALLTAGRVAPCFSPAVGFFMQRYHDLRSRHERRPLRLMYYRNGYRGLLQGERFDITEEDIKTAPLLVAKAGSPIGGSRVRLSNLDHLMLRKLIASKQDDPYDTCAKQLVKDGVDILHVVGSNNANQTALQLVEICKHQYSHTIRAIGLPKTTENDMAPVQQSLGAITAAKEGAQYFFNIVPEHQANPRMLIIHVIKGFSGWLCAATAREYRKILNNEEFVQALGQGIDNYDLHGVYTPEMVLDFPSEVVRLRRCMDRLGNVNIFVSHGTSKDAIIADAKRRGIEVPKHEILGYPIIDAGKYFSDLLSKGLRAEKVLVQHSDIYVRAAAPCAEDIRLVQSCVSTAVDIALNEEGSSSGVVGHDVNYHGLLHLIPHSSMSGSRPFDINTPWFVQLLGAIGQPVTHPKYLSKM